MIKVGDKVYRNLQEQVSKNKEDIEEISKKIPYPPTEYYNKEETDEKFETKEEAFSGSYDDLTDVPTYYVYSLRIWCYDSEEGYEFTPILQTIPTSENLGEINDNINYADIVDYLFLKQVGYDDHNGQICSIDYLSTTELGLRKYDGTAYDDHAQAEKITVRIVDKKEIA